MADYMGSQYYDRPGHKKQQLKKGYSYSKDLSDAMGGKKVHTIPALKPRHLYGGKGRPFPGRKEVNIYKIPARAPAPAAPAPAPAPAPEPEPKAPPKEPIKHSSEIEQAKDRVQAYENGKSPWEQAEANVQSSFTNNQYDFSGKTFQANQSSKPNEQAQAAQNQMQNYISKYSGFKSSNN